MSVLNNLKLLRKIPKSIRKRGVVNTSKIAYGLFAYKFFSWVARILGEVNDENYWNIRHRFNWDQSNGGLQTRQFAVAMLIASPLDDLEKVSSILDYGCGTGESVPVLACAFPRARFFLHDLSKVGVRSGVRKFGHSLMVEGWDFTTQADLVYTSNTIEHVQNPELFVQSITKAARSFIILQCPWQEYHDDGSKISPERPAGEHFWTIDGEFIDRYLCLPGWEWIAKKVVRVPLAWDHGEQLVLVGRKI